MRHFVHLLLTIALILSLASPACKFISGEHSSLIEICAADGSLKNVAVPDAFNPFKKPAEDHKKHDNDPCAFCFAQTHLKPLQSTAVLVAAYPPESFLIAARPYSLFYVRPELGAIAPRAPPRLT
ncbi:MAG: DUF2946 family protein [Alphaproteobacteria bacterium]|nr:DUF2946 family protein [Alphaproteobacteria bacterium]